MIPKRKRGEQRTNLAEILDYNMVNDVTKEILPVVEDILQRGLRFCSDRVHFMWTHKSDSALNFYPLDYTLNNTEMKDINKYLMGYKDITETVLGELAEILANDILRNINKALDRSPAGVVVSFAVPDMVKYESTIPNKAYAFLRRDVRGNVLEMESNYKIEEVLWQNSDQ